MDHESRESARINPHQCSLHKENERVTHSVVWWGQLQGAAMVQSWQLR